MKQQESTEMSNDHSISSNTVTIDPLQLEVSIVLLNPVHPKFPAERLAFSSRKHRVRLRGTPLPLRSLPGGQAWWGGRWMISGRDGAYS